ncbi:MAG: sensor of ECF-type sigma factor [Flavobacteriaceae bacterium]|nr:sensor of ECF-type sigma factor [Flavobacteriaceae bacterium]
MKTKNIFTVLLILLSISFYAQETKIFEKKEKIYALKVAFISNDLSLTSNEAEKFWPIYNSYENKQFDLKRQKFISFIKKIDNESLNKMSDKEALIVLTQMEATEDELFQMQKKLIFNLKSVISPVKIIKLKKAEEEFKKKLLQQYRDKGPRR